MKEIKMILSLILLFTIALLINPAASAGIEITNAEAIYEANFSNVSIPTEPYPVKNIFTLNVEAIFEQNLSSVSILSQPIPIKEIFIVNEEATFNTSLTPPLNGSIAGTVTNIASGAAIPGATVTASIGATTIATAITNASGGYNISIAPGTYNVTASAVGFVTQSVAGIVVASGAVVVQNFDLPPIAAVNIVSIQDVSAAPASEHRVAIIIHNSTGVAGVSIKLRYNPGVVLAYSDPVVDKGDFTDFYASDNSFNASGYITINTYKTVAGSITPLALIGNPVVGYVRLRAVGSSGSSSALNLSDIVLTDDLGNDLPDATRNGTFTIVSDSAPPIVTNPTTNQSVIPDDTDYIPLWGETAQLSATVIDDSGVASVTINLSEIGGPTAKPMTNTGGGVYSTTTNASAGTPPKLYNLTVTATDTFGNPNTSVSIQLRVMRNGDCTGNGLVNIGDALRLANNVSYPGNPAYTLSSPYVCEVTGNGAINIGDALRLANNVSYPGNPAYILK